MIAFVFPGQGSQRVGMGKALAAQYPVCRETFEQADAALGESMSRLCFEGPADVLTLTENTQPAIVAVSIAVFRLLKSCGIAPAFVAGHSLGEYSANVAAGTISFADALRTVRRRGRYMQEAVPVGEGAMAAVIGLDVDTVSRACAEAAEGEVVSPANLNAPGVIPLAVSAPFHCALMKPAASRLEADLRELVVSDPTVPVVANVDATLKRDASAAIEALVSQVTSPVRWEDVVRRLLASGVRTFVEVGPGRVLSGLIKKIDRTVRVVSVEDPDGFVEVERLVTA